MFRALRSSQVVRQGTLDPRPKVRTLPPEPLVSPLPPAGAINKSEPTRAWRAGSGRGRRVVLNRQGSLAIDRALASGPCRNSSASSPAGAACSCWRCLLFLPWARLSPPTSTPPREHPRRCRTNPSSPTSAPAPTGLLVDVIGAVNHPPLSDDAGRSGLRRHRSGAAILPRPPTRSERPGATDGEQVGFRSPRASARRWSLEST